MKKNRLMEECRNRFVTPDIQKQVDLCVGIANRVYYLLEQKNMSQKELAQKLGKTETEVSRWLSGTHNLTVATIAKLAIALDDDIIKPTCDRYSYKSPDTAILAAAEDAVKYSHK